MKAPLFLATTLLISIATAGWVTPDDQAKKTRDRDETRPLMRAKLQGSEYVLDGLVTEDFSLIRRGAENMKNISLAVQWPRSQDQVYDHFGDEFRRQCDSLMDLADKRNLEGAHFTYLSMTTTCINCHNYVRRSFRVERDATHPQGPVRLIPTEWEGNTKRLQKSAESTGLRQKR